MTTTRTGTTPSLHASRSRRRLSSADGWEPERAAASTLAAGGGVQLVAVAELGWSSIGLDVSHNQLRIARDRRGVRALVQADATRAPFVDESFDAVVAG